MHHRLLGNYQFEVRKRLNPSEAKNAMAVCENAITKYLAQYPEDQTKSKITNRFRALIRQHGISIFATALKSLITYGIVEEYPVEGAVAPRYRLKGA